VKFTWDEVKRQINLQRHGFDFKDAAIVFAGEVVTIEDNRYDLAKSVLQRLVCYLAVL